MISRGKLPLFILGLLVFISPDHSPASSKESPARHVYRVDDPNLVNQLVEAGSTVVAEYESFCLVESDPSTLAALSGHPRELVADAR